MPNLLRGALIRQRGWSTPTRVDVVLRHLEEPALKDHAWAVAVAVAKSGHVNFEDGASVSDWAAAVAASMRRAEDG